jgi:hypothetical protein
MREAALSTDAQYAHGVPELYERMGFQKVKRTTLWRKPQKLGESPLPVPRGGEVSERSNAAVQASAVSGLGFRNLQGDADYPLMQSILIESTRADQVAEMPCYLLGLTHSMTGVSP